MYETFQENDFLTILILGTLAMMFIVVLVIVFFLSSKNRILREKQQKEQLKLQHKENLLRSNIQAQEAERSRLAGELHDDIGSKLCVVKLFANQLMNIPAGTNESTDHYEKTMNIIDQLIDTTRRISHELYPPMLEELGLTSTVQQFITTINSIHDKELTLSCDKEPNYETFVKLQIFRIIQESIKNALNHGKADVIKVFINDNEDHTSFIIRDNGIGFDTSKINQGKGMGLKNLFKRAEMINGELDVHSDTHTGTNISLKIPHNHETE
jgi:signal transduction histidine kinase